MWLECWNALGAILIATKSVNRSTLCAYKKFIESLAKSYGPVVWPLLYQTDVRCRSERIPLLRTRLVTAHNAAVTAGTPSAFDANRPWDAAFNECIVSQDSVAWWSKEFERPALLVLTKTGNLTTMIEGDARIEQSNASS